MPFEVSEDHQRIVIEQMFAHMHFPQMIAWRKRARDPGFSPGFLKKGVSAWYRNRHIAFLVHNVHRAEGPAIFHKQFTMARCLRAPAGIEHIAFHNACERDVFHKRPGKLSGWKIGRSRFSCMELDGYLAGYGTTDLVVE